MLRSKGMILSYSHRFENEELLCTAKNGTGKRFPSNTKAAFHSGELSGCDRATLDRRWACSSPFVSPSASITAPFTGFVSSIGSGFEQVSFYTHKGHDDKRRFILSFSLSESVKTRAFIKMLHKGIGEENGCDKAVQVGITVAIGVI